jgi:hypothetical protein
LSLAPGGRLGDVSWIFVLLLAGAVLVLAGAEWPRLEERFGGGRRRRERARRRETLTLVRSDSEEFAASVARDLEQLPTIEREERR